MEKGWVQMAAANKQTPTPAQWKAVADHLIELSQRMSQASPKPAAAQNGAAGAVGSGSSSHQEN
jgi:hypothetical protein